MTIKTRTIICDIDGCILKHYESGATYQWSGISRDDELLPGVRAAFNKWESESACIVLMTARKECCRADLERTLRRHGLFWDHLIMGVGHGERILINDVKPFDTHWSAAAICLPRNEGLERFAKEIR